MTTASSLLIVVVLLLIGAIPGWPHQKSHNKSWKQGPAGIFVLALIILMLLWLMK
jgi:membrane protein DedA with SNARE-associated domain